MIYPKLKDPYLNSVMENDTVKRKELAWENVTSKVQDVLFPLMQATNAEQKLLLQVPSEEVAKPPDVVPMDSVTPSNTLNHAIKAYAQRRSTEKKSDIQSASQLIPI